jgi:hypothetical protein
MCWDPEMEWMVVIEMLGAAATWQVPANTGRSVRGSPLPKAITPGVAVRPKKRIDWANEPAYGAG